MTGLILAGAAYGGLQNLTLAQAFIAAGEPARSTVSIAWNLSFDTGTGLGAFATGAIAAAISYPAAFGVLAVAAGLVGGSWVRPGRWLCLNRRMGKLDELVLARVPGFPVDRGNPDGGDGRWHGAGLEQRAGQGRMNLLGYAW